MGCIKLSILDEQYKKTEIRVSYNKKELTFNFCDNNSAEENNTVISHKQYAGKAFEIDYVTGKKYHYIYAYGEPVAVVIQQGDGEFIPYSILTDHLGSIDLIVDKNGNIVDSMSFDPWGNRRDRYDWSQGEDENVVHLIDRGFTGHQHLDVFNLINMGGRVYDPVTQQFLSPDPYVADATSTQGLNRYTYCMNSPMMYTDPTGEFVVVDSWISGFLRGLVQGKNAWKTANQAAMNDIKIWGGLFTSDKNKNWLGQTWEVISRFTWQLPQTLAGFVFSNVSNLGWQVDNVSYKYGATILSGNFFGSTAVTLGNYINGNHSLKAELGNSLFQHEYGHYLQSQAVGPYYFQRYGIPSLCSKGIHKNHPVEQDANARALTYFTKKIDDFNWYDHEKKQWDSYWDFDRFPINGYDRSHYPLSSVNQAAMDRVRLQPAWHDWLLGPNILLSGFAINTPILNGKKRTNIIIRDGEIIWFRY